jgi:hypothetical protein
MAGIRRKQIKNLLKKGTLTGFEVAKIVMHEVYEYEKMAKPELFDIGYIDATKHYSEVSILTPEELIVLKDKNLYHDEKIDEYNSWLEALDSFLTVIYSAHVIYLKIGAALSFSQIFMERYLTESIVKIDLSFIPDILTEKQYQDLKAKQRQEKLKMKWNLGWILFYRANTLVNEKDPDFLGIEELMEGSPKDQKEAVKHIKQACIDIRSLIKDGKLSMTYQKNVPSLLDRIITKKTDKDVLAYIDSSISVEPKHKLKKPEPLLEKSTTTGEALYNTGLSEWIKDIDEYNHNWDGSAPYQCAIIQNPFPQEIDDKGYYKKRKSLIDHNLIGNPDTVFWGKLKQTPRTAFTTMLLNVKHNIKMFLFKRSLTKVLTEETGVNFSEQTDKWYENIKFLLTDYETTLERAITASDRAREALSDLLDVIDLDELQIKPETEDKFRKSLWGQDIGSEYLRLIKAWSMNCQIIYED